MPDDMPDIGSVLNAWGQVLLRSKQWRDGTMTVSGGVMVWILYMPDSEVVTPQTAQAWIPFQVKFDLPEAKRDGMIWVSPLLQGVDARSTSARKMVARASVSVLAQAYLPENICIYSAQDIPEDVQLNIKTYPLRLPMEIGEKEFSFDEELTLPSSVASVSKIVRFSLQPELIDKKVLSGKAIFRGIGLLHVLYMDENDELCAWDFEIPFSQYAQLDADYEQSAEISVLPVVTGMELDVEAPDKLRLKAAITGQYMIYDVQMTEVVQDAYSTHRNLELEQQDMELASILEQKQQTLNTAYKHPRTVQRILDVAFYPDHPLVHRELDNCCAELSGVFHVLYLDDRNQLCADTCRWNDRLQFPAAQDVKVELSIRPNGVAQAVTASADMLLQADCTLEMMTFSTKSIPMITGLKLGQNRQPEADRPCLVIRRKGNSSLWDLAKRYDSTVSAIERANNIKDDAQENKMLLIPIL